MHTHISALYSRTKTVDNGLFTVKPTYFGHHLDRMAVQGHNKSSLFWTRPVLRSLRYLPLIQKCPHLQGIPVLLGEAFTAKVVLFVHVRLYMYIRAWQVVKPLMLYILLVYNSVLHTFLY